MIISPSRIEIARSCMAKLSYKMFLGLPFVPSVEMSTGTGFHHAISVALSTKDWNKAIEEGQEMLRSEMSKKLMLVEEEYLVEEQVKLLSTYVNKYRELYKDEPYQVIQPECKFFVPIGPPKNSIFTHWLRDGEERWNGAALHDSLEDSVKHSEEFSPDRFDWDDIVNKRITSPHPTPDPSCPCYHPHKLVGIADAIVKWKGRIWFLEHKTASRVDQTFWDDFLLDVQPTAYMYGIKQSTGMMPAGFVVNAIRKPSRKQVLQWNKRASIDDYVELSREAFVRTEEQVQDFVNDTVALCDEIEARVNANSPSFLANQWPMSNTRGTCTKYYRLCEYHSICSSSRDLNEIEQVRETMKKALASSYDSD